MFWIGQVVGHWHTHEYSKYLDGYDANENLPYIGFAFHLTFSNSKFSSSFRSVAEKSSVFWLFVEQWVFANTYHMLSSSF